MKTEKLVIVEMLLPNPSNTREHWVVRAKRVKQQRMRAHYAALGFRAQLPARVKLTRVWAPPQRALDDDGVVASLKAVRDGIADAYGIDDRDPRVSWKYHQAPGAMSGLWIEVRPLRRAAKTNTKALPRKNRKPSFASRLSPAVVRP